MTIARTKIEPTLMPLADVKNQNAIEGKVVHFEDFSVTDSSDTTAAMYLGGLLPWRLINESGGPITFTFNSARSLNGNALSPYDVDVQPVLTITLVDDGDIELDPGLSGIAWLVITGSAPADHITLICRR